MTSKLRETRLPRILLALAVAAATIAGSLSLATAENAKVLGKTKNAPSPNCPAKKLPPGQSPNDNQVCQVTGQVTGFQRSADGKSGLFKVKEDGKIVAWSVDMADPRKSERKVFGDASKTNAFGKAPTAGISIIRSASGKDFRLKSASPLLSMRSYYGEKPVITLDQPLNVKEGDVVALTTATWLPAFSIKGQGPKDVWVASRRAKDWEGKECNIPSNVPDNEALKYFFDHSSPQRKIGSERPYECAYTGARILYWAYFVPDN